MVNILAELGPVEAAEASEQWLPEDVLLDPLLVQVTWVNDHIFVHDVHNALGKARRSVSGSVLSLLFGGLCHF